MRTRIVACVMGGLTGVAVSAFIPDNSDWSAALVTGVCAVIGMGLGYLGSVLFQVFTMSSEEQ